MAAEKAGSIAGKAGLTAVAAGWDETGTLVELAADAAGTLAELAADAAGMRAEPAVDVAAPHFLNACSLRAAAGCNTASAAGPVELAAAPLERQFVAVAEEGFALLLLAAAELVPLELEVGAQMVPSGRSSIEA